MTFKKTNTVGSGRMICFLPFEWVEFCCGNYIDATTAFYRLKTRKNFNNPALNTTDHYRLELHMIYVDSLPSSC